jgi:hypothetical protein
MGNFGTYRNILECGETIAGIEKCGFGTLWKILASWAFQGILFTVVLPRRLGWTERWPAQM